MISLRTSALVRFGVCKMIGVISDKSIHYMPYGVHAETGVVSLILEERFRFEPSAAVGVILLKSKIYLSQLLLLLSIVLFEYVVGLGIANIGPTTTTAVVVCWSGRVRSSVRIVGSCAWFFW